MNPQKREEHLHQYDRSAQPNRFHRDWAYINVQTEFRCEDKEVGNKIDPTHRHDQSPMTQSKNIEEESSKRGEEK